MSRSFVFTVGHSTRQISDFIHLLKSHGVQRVAEAVPWRCHRSLIADALVARGIDALEIVSAAAAHERRE